MTTTNTVVCGHGAVAGTPNCGETREAIDVCVSCHTCTYNGCCECWTCTHCNTMFGQAAPACTTCGFCAAGCQCVTCTGCQRRNTRTYMHHAPRGNIPPCNRCENCCRCGQPPPRIEFIASPRVIVFHESMKLHKVNPSKRFIAAEIEVATVGENGIVVSDVVRGWRGAVVHDGSVQGEVPFEINTAPAAGDKFTQQIDEICAALKTAGGEVNKTCGLHTHVDARDFNFYDIRKFAFLYEKIEEGLFSIIAPSRKTNRYCQPCGKKYVKDLESNIIPKANEKTLIKNVYGHDERIATLRGNKYTEARYAAMNLHSWVFRGTIENRMHQGTVNAKKIKMWAMLNAGILDYAYDNTEKLIKSIKGNPIQILMDIAPTPEVAAWVEKRSNHFKAGDKTDLNGETDNEE